MHKHTIGRLTHTTKLSQLVTAAIEIFLSIHYVKVLITFGNYNS